VHTHFNFMFTWVYLKGELNMGILCQGAAEFLSPQLGTEELLLLHAYWAKLECNIGKDLAAARGVWENTIKKRLYYYYLCRVHTIFSFLALS
jgi:hypothetical protein